MKCIVFFIVLLCSTSSFANLLLTNGQLTQEEKYELQVIKRNYHRYSSELRTIAYNRVNEIKYKMLPYRLQISNFDARIRAFPIQYDYYMKNLKHIVLIKQQYYMRLSHHSKEELVKFKYNLVSEKDLSQQSLNYLKNQAQLYQMVIKK
ncbi:hypothetical protein [Candidatus Neoehrlichia procyonis]|uniref:Uncharacterized protein n=1 Tax=Candidatus Neoehrlichia procyonis str. RAC413 TaxID=1359163 RepID=A0A0F3NL05_9RICK|nr:hypothetical protein [Candidatus Neoehrlichia lotoris]KJV68738.1 hypothetical protein NLO413_0099 [Candidatus Neoehrlichia lotoris str. RAC413]